MPKLNWKIILSNLAEAREQIEQIEERASNRKKPSEIELQVMLVWGGYYIGPYNKKDKNSAIKIYSVQRDNNKWLVTEKTDTE